MSTRALPHRPESPRFIHQQNTIDILAMAQERLDGLNYDYHELSFQNNPKSNTYPYEGAVLFGIDKRPTDRASALLHSPSFGIDHGLRLDFFEENIKNRRIILSQSALSASLRDGKKNHAQEFHDSKMNFGKQIVWAQPLIHEGENVAAVQLAFTINDPRDWTLPSNGSLDKIWEKHRHSTAEVAHSLADLALETSSLSKSLEIMPPTKPDTIVIRWDVVDSCADALNGNYAIQEAYLETWKQERKEMTNKFHAQFLDRGDGEYVILPFENVNLNDNAAMRRYAQKMILPVVNEVITRHATIAKAYLPEMFKRIKVTVGDGNIEEDQDGNPTGQVLYELKNLAEKSAKSLVFSPSAEKLLF